MTKPHTPYFIYSGEILERQLSAIQMAFGPRFEVSYAVKTNPHKKLLNFLNTRVKQLDVSSEGEINRALSCGYAPDRLSFTGPGKTKAELLLATKLEGITVILEGEEEAEFLSGLAREANRTLKALLRINPSRRSQGFAIGMSGLPSQFGFDEEDLSRTLPPLLKLPNLHVSGLHVFSGSQCLDAQSLGTHLKANLELLFKITKDFDIPPQTLILGAGFGVPYHEKDFPLELKETARIVKRSESLNTKELAHSRLILETGRFLVGPAGKYVTSVVRTKHSRGKQIVICDGGMHHFAAAAGMLGGLWRRNFKMNLISGKKPTQASLPTDIYGPLCTSLDCLMQNADLPKISIGDKIEFENAGAYGPSASPVQFISRELPDEIFV